MEIPGQVERIWYSSRGNTLSISPEFYLSITNFGVWFKHRLDLDHESMNRGSGLEGVDPTRSY